MEVCDEDSEESFMAYCPCHGPFLVITDNDQIDNKIIGTKAYAKATLPKKFLQIFLPAISGPDGYGVITKRLVPKGAVFGPYVGVVVSEEERANKSDYSWQIFKNGKGLHYVDAKDPSKSNWMRYVKRAGTQLKHNVSVFQHQGEVFYKAVEDLPEGTEVVVGYGKEYAKDMGSIKETKSKPPEAEPSTQEMNTLMDQFRVNDGIYRCPDCKALYADFMLLLKHRMCMHSVPLPVMKVQAPLYKCDLCPCSFYSKGNLAMHKTKSHGK